MISNRTIHYNITYYIILYYIILYYIHLYYILHDTCRGVGSTLKTGFSGAPAPLAATDGGAFGAPPSLQVVDGAGSTLLGPAAHAGAGAVLGQALFRGGAGTRYGNVGKEAA